MLGVVDISGPRRTAHLHSLGLVMAAAAMAEEQLRRDRERADDRLRRLLLERSGGAVAVADAAGRVVETRVPRPHRPAVGPGSYLASTGA